jgi:DNA-binding CsgD family transcriptional regulator/PAS domain-containing protein
VGTVDSELVDLIGAIYDAVLDPALWQEALDRIRQHFAFNNSILGLFRYRGNEALTTTVTVNVPEAYLSAIHDVKYTPEIVRMWGGAQQIARYPVEEPIQLLSVTDPRTLATNAYYRDFGIPQGLVDQVVVALTRDRRQVGNVAFGRHRDVGPVTDDVVAGLRILAPHLRRAALITGILDEERKARTMLESVLSAVRSGVTLVDRAARVVYANPAAQAIIDAGEPLRNQHGKLELRGEVVPGQLQLAIAAAAEGDVPLGRRGIAIPGARADGTPFVAHVLPLGDRSVRTGMPGEAVAAVFIADRDDDPHLIVDAATMIYSLTPTEARAFELIVAGHSSAEIAAAMAISANTLKWHTRQLFDKTGQHRRADLVRLAGRLRAGQL